MPVFRLPAHAATPGTHLLVPQTQHSHQTRFHGTGREDEHVPVAQTPIGEDATTRQQLRKLFGSGQTVGQRVKAGCQ